MTQARPANSLQELDAKPPLTVNERGLSPIVLACDHASNEIPDGLDNLGLPEEALNSHIAWDPGAFEVALRMSVLLDAPLVACQVSRLVIDCNRKTDAADSIPVRSENLDIPGNVDLSDRAHKLRVQTVYQPFHDCLARVINARKPRAVLVAVHSFTPVFLGKQRKVELGILHDRDTRLADAMLARAGRHTRLVVCRNEPYSAKDGVTHTLVRHGVSNGLLNVMLEVRSDLISSSIGQESMASLLAGLLSSALDDLGGKGSGGRAA